MLWYVSAVPHYLLLGVFSHLTRILVEKPFTENIHEFKTTYFGRTIYVTKIK